MSSLAKALAVGASRFGQQPEISWQDGDAEPATTGLRDWLLKGTGYSNVQQETSGAIAIDCIDDSWAQANASDLIASREAAMESLQPRQSEVYSNRSVAWPMLTSYYATYFAVQSFLRCLGLGSVFLDGREADLLSAAWKAHGYAVGLSAGNYGFSIDLRNPVKMSFRKMGSRAGAHQQFWSAFRQSQNEIHEVLLLSPALGSMDDVERQGADSEYSKFVRLSFTDTSVVPSAQNFAWLTDFRNGVNYRFAGNVWLMNWRHASGLITNHQALIDRYLNSQKSLPEAQRNFSRNHLLFVAARICQLICAGTTRFTVP